MSVVTEYPVVGQLSTFAAGTGTQFCSFMTPTVHGLARVEGKRIDLLAVVAVVSGRGDFGRFVDDLKRSYETIAVWEIWNADLNSMLHRRGFKPVREDVDGDLVTGVRWDRK